ncbi:CoB--CoM heterodisulfide reductase iron-sulfur subunit B family protein [Desulfocurvus vexinensis]|uniref:CoB--CoM heterodisulfide reductase iron-sulfur subunit B family protein n=1 Tax=Desulfocurvus vexinensis TaxID=399548 RepID=UPI0004B1B1D7|nr:CoB--CoM heterodisulfide reductase iron-sulfur subunit B family protein [Desulfocurvus vexinensis]
MTTATDVQYAYYPGCSLTGTALEYDVSTRLVLERLGARVTEIPGWTCCGASAAPAVSALLAMALPARNLALAERDLPGCDVLAPCSACYLNLLAARQEARRDHKLYARVQDALAGEGLPWENSAEVRHLLDVLANDIGPARIAGAVEHPLAGLTLAPYYGCQTLRPYAAFDDPEHPVSMDAVLRATGAEVLAWDKGARCCGASLSTTHREAALPRIAEILNAAAGADAVVTVCPMCQMNLEAFQRQAGLARPVAVLYLPQVLGLAMGLDAGQVLLGKNLAVPPGFLARLREGPPAPQPVTQAAGAG